jgi:D-alanyl-D-alanine carboxypeptidase
MLAPWLCRVAAVACSAVLGLGLAGCGAVHGAGPAASAPSTRRTAASHTTAPASPTPCAATVAPGHIGIVLHDRTSGATWRNADAVTDFPAASTIKLAMVLDLMLRNRAGSIHLDDDGWDLIDAILSASSDTAADHLWSQFEGSSVLSRIKAFGMTSTYFTASPAYWGFMYCSAQDLDNLMNYLLNDAPATVSNYITNRMRRVAPIQQWGVWGAGPANQPGNKDGWEDDSGTWIVNTVGFAGSGARYSLAVMDDLAGAADFHQGTDTLDQISALLFQGHYGPEPTVEATP